MTDFSLHHVGSWKAGEAPTIKTATYVVAYDQKSDAYQIESTDFDSFVEWVASIWPGDNDVQEETETTESFLDRIGVSISEM